MIYVASRVKHAPMWRSFRDRYPIGSTWIDEGETECFTELWARIEMEVKESSKLVFYAASGDFPFKGALVEVGMAVAFGVPVLVVLGEGVEASLEGRTFGLLGSWIKHPDVRLAGSLEEALSGVKP